MRELWEVMLLFVSVMVTMCGVGGKDERWSVGILFG